MGQDERALGPEADKANLEEEEQRRTKLPEETRALTNEICGVCRSLGPSNTPPDAVADPNTQTRGMFIFPSAAGPTVIMCICWDDCGSLFCWKKTHKVSIYQPNLLNMTGSNHLPVEESPMVNSTDILKIPSLAPVRPGCPYCGKNDQWSPFPEISGNLMVLKCRCGVGSVTLSFDRDITLGDFFPGLKKMAEANKAPEEKLPE